MKYTIMAGLMLYAEIEKTVMRMRTSSARFWVMVRMNASGVMRSVLRTTGTTSWVPLKVA